MHLNCDAMEYVLTWEERAGGHGRAHAALKPTAHGRGVRLLRDHVNCHDVDR